MIVTEISETTEYGDGDFFEILIDGEHFASGSGICDSPEDMTLGRSLSFLYSISDMLRKAWEDGRDGVPFMLIQKDGCED